MSKRPRPAGSSILLSPPTNPFTGLYYSIRHPNFLMAATSLATAASKFLPMLLTIVPFQSTQTWKTHLVCAWLTVAVLGFMMAVVAWSICAARPRMAVEPCTVAGVMWYLCDAAMLDQFAGLGAASKAELARRTENLWMTYRFGRLAGVAGGERIGIDFAVAEGSRWRAGTGQ